ncbi:MAG TPA: hypothetical protein VN377_04145 [Candidatus Thermoplasmatota archaeon]|nr:hypothetical protein [Candidatus Thermoplasmatota archaeon]
MSTHSKCPGLDGIWDPEMPAAGQESKSQTNVWRKTIEQQLFNELEDECGFAKATWVACTKCCKM